MGVMEQACRDPRNLRVGATTDPLQVGWGGGGEVGWVG